MERHEPRKTGIVLGTGWHTSLFDFSLYDDLVVIDELQLELLLHGAVPVEGNVQGTQLFLQVLVPAVIDVR
jgi:hypothetical protein